MYSIDQFINSTFALKVNKECICKMKISPEHSSYIKYFAQYENGYLFSYHISNRSAANILQMTLIGHMGDNTCAYMWVEYCSTHERSALYIHYIYLYSIQNLYCIIICYRLVTLIVCIKCFTFLYQTNFFLPAFQIQISFI